MAFLVGDLRRQPRGRRPDVALLQPEPTGRVLRERGRRRGRLARRRDPQRFRKQLRDTARLGYLRPDPLQAPRADAVPAEERPAPDLVECRRSEMSELNAAVAAAALGSEDRFRELLRSVVEVARSIFAAKASPILLPDEERKSLFFR